ncbi:UNVERIFIED_ORG: phosphoglycolate phosphatase-like HAD superfamily hydrolase [Idiomarina abyssalis]|uniref:HAD family hydrolase n=1 Tax=Idiomarina sp. 017G TaxID=2183988 RepID=UPI000E0EBA83|nr:HAD family hydrolase [Idiomarina sp. 017G]TDO50231.1 phosphoglycolate phosphatase-like HAD superfamily hydrolase [Idiomarina sp. 017G]
MELNVTSYSTLVFDCDGVVLDSNKVKTESFYKAALPYGERAADELVEYHVANGGVSRYKKFSYFLDHIVEKPSEAALKELLADYAANVQAGLQNCAIAPALERLRNRTPHSRWLIVSGGDQAELREIFQMRGLSDWFDAGIFGSPDTKEDILTRELENGNILTPALFIGDSKYDFKAAKFVGLDFVFLSGWSEVKGWESWVAENGICATRNMESLMSLERE